VHVCHATPRNDAQFVAATVVVVCVQWLMNVADEVDQETEGLGADWSEQGMVGKDRSLTFDLGDNAVVTPAVPLCIIATASDRYVDEVPWRS